MRFILNSFGSFGDLNPYIGLGLALQSRGHDVVLAVPSQYVPFVTSAGLVGTPVRPEIDPNDRDTVRRVMDPFRGAEFLIRDWLMPRVEEAYADLDALVTRDDILVSHPLTFAAPVVAEHRRLRWASSVLAPLGFFSTADPPLMAVHPAMETLQRRWPGLYRRLVPAARFATRSWGTPVYELRRRLGLPRGADPVLVGQFSPWLTVAMFSPVLAAPQRDWPHHTVVTGAVSYDAVLGDLPGPLAAFLDAGPPPVVFTLGSAAVAAESAPAFYRASIEAVRDIGARAVLLVGPLDNHRPETGDRDDVFVADWAPHSQLFARAAATVHQGGAGTLHTALAAGRPMLVVPHAHDQGDNAVRATRLGVARVLFPGQYRRTAVASSLQALLAEPEYRSRAAAVGSVVRSERGAERASQALETLLRVPANPPGRSAVPIP